MAIRSKDDAESLRALAADRRNVKPDGPLDAVEVVVQAARRLDEQRRRHALEVQREAQLLLEQILDKADRLLRIIEAEARAVPLRNPNLVHENHSRLPGAPGGK